MKSGNSFSVNLTPRPNPFLMTLTLPLRIVRITPFLLLFFLGDSPVKSNVRVIDDWQSSYKFLIKYSIRHAVITFFNKNNSRIFVNSWHV